MIEYFMVEENYYIPTVNIRKWSLMIGNSNAEKIVKVFIDYCKEKNYQYKQSEDSNFVRIDISNITERTLVNIYYTSRILIQGSKNALKNEFEDLKVKFEANPQSFIKDDLPKIKACTARYDIMLSDFRTEIKRSLNTLGTTLEIIDNPYKAIDYKAKITRNGFSLSLTQYSNGTLLLQGKTDKLFSDCCDNIEKIANPAEHDVIARFISSDEKGLEVFTSKYTPRLIELAETKVKEEVGCAYNFLEPYDKKWFVASECLCLTEIPLPEYSPLVMPASKAFEGFAKKLLVGIGLFPIDFFKLKTATFSILNDKDHPARKSICAKEKHADTMLKKISLCLDVNRNFMMHSDESKITKVESQNEAVKKVNDIFVETKQIFEYFNGIYNL